MKIISIGYTNTPGFTDPDTWLDRISFYTGILEELAKQHEVESIEQISYSGILQRRGVGYHFLDLKTEKSLFPDKLHRYIAQMKPGVVFVNGFIFPLNIIHLRLRLGKKVKIIVLHRAEKPFTGIKRYFQKLADKCVDAYLFTSSEFSDMWKRNINVRKIHEVIQASSIFHPADKADARRQTNTNGDPVFLWVGRLDVNKDPLTVIKAFLNYLNNQPGAKLYLIYQGEELLQEVKDLIRIDERGEGAVILIGKVDHQQMQDWYNSADFIISGSHYEGSGIAVCEAMSCGCIPIVTNILSFRRMSGLGKCGLLYGPGNEKELLTALLSTGKMDIEKERAKVSAQFNEELSFGAIAGKINKIIL
ncbi:MAG TPA: glycosyltransferase family 4 protein [Chitinophagaceae bacterium]